MSVEFLRRLTTVPTEPDAAMQPPRSLTESEIAYMRAIETDEDRLAQNTAAQAASNREYQNSLEGRTGQYRNGDPPSARELGVKVAGLPPAQEQLVRYHGWCDQAKAEAARLTLAREGFYSAMGAPTVSQAALHTLIQRDTTGFLAWVRSGAEKAAQFSVDSFRRKQIEQKLAEETHEAEIARAGLAGIDADIAFADEVVRILERRHTEFVRAVIREAAEGRVAEYQAVISSLQQIVEDLAGAGKILNDGRFFGPDSINVSLPRFGHAHARLVVGRAEIDRAAEPWRAKEQALLANPRANIRDQG